MSNFGRRKFLTYSSAIASSSVLLKACAPDLSANDPTATNNGLGAPIPESEQSEISVGLLHSLSGPMAITEAPLVDAEMLAIEEINAKGGLLGKPIVPFIEDCASDWPTYAEKAEKLIKQQNATVIFGGFTSASRKAMLPVVTANNKLLWYPGAYEGQECIKSVFYAGPTANQQVEPAVNWLLGNRGKSFFLLSSGDRTTHKIVKSILKEKGGKVAGEAFVPLKKGVVTDMKPVIDDIKQALPEGGIIFNTLDGAHNRDFFQALKGAGLRTSRYLVMSIRLSESEIPAIGKHFLHNHYATWGYFQSLEGPDNEQWVQRFQKRYGNNRVVSAPMENAYSMVYLWAQAARQARSTEADNVIEASYGQTFSAPSGLIVLEANHHVSRPSHVGKIHDNGQFEILWSTATPIEPNPWSQRIESSTGFGCDWQDADKGDKYDMTQQNESVMWAAIPLLWFLNRL